MNMYAQMIEGQQKEIDDFLGQYAFFAFSNEQFKQGCQKLGIPETAKHVLVRLGSTGGFILKDRAAEYGELVARLAQDRQAAIDNPDTGAQFAFDMFTYELANHEYSYTGDVEETLDALGYTREEIEKSPTLKEALGKARKHLLA